MKKPFIFITLSLFSLPYSLPSYSEVLPALKDTNLFKPKYFCHYPSCTHMGGYILHSTLNLHYLLSHIHQIPQQVISPQNCLVSAEFVTSAAQYVPSQREPYENGLPLIVDDRETLDGIIRNHLSSNLGSSSQLNNPLSSFTELYPHSEQVGAGKEELTEQNFEELMDSEVPHIGLLPPNNEGTEGISHEE